MWTWLLDRFFRFLSRVCRIKNASLDTSSSLSSSSGNEPVLEVTALQNLVEEQESTGLEPVPREQEPLLPRSVIVPHTPHERLDSVHRQDSGTAIVTPRRHQAGAPKQQYNEMRKVPPTNPTHRHCHAAPNATLPTMSSSLPVSFPKVPDAMEQLLSRQFKSFEEILDVVEVQGTSWYHQTGAAERYHSFQNALAVLQAEGAALKDLLRQRPEYPAEHSMPDERVPPVTAAATTTSVPREPSNHPRSVTTHWQDLAQNEHQSKKRIRKLPFRDVSRNTCHANDGGNDTDAQMRLGSVAKIPPHYENHHVYQNIHREDENDDDNQKQDSKRDLQDDCPKRRPKRTLCPDDGIVATTIATKRMNDYITNTVKSPTGRRKKTRVLCDHEGHTSTKRIRKVIIVYSDDDCDEDDDSDDETSRPAKRSRKVFAIGSDDVDDDDDEGDDTIVPRASSSRQGIIDTTDLTGKAQNDDALSHSDKSSDTSAGDGMENYSSAGDGMENSFESPDLMEHHTIFPAIKQEDFDLHDGGDQQTSLKMAPMAFDLATQDALVRELPSQHQHPTLMMDTSETENNSNLKAPPRYESKDGPCQIANLVTGGKRQVVDTPQYNGGVCQVNKLQDNEDGKPSFVIPVVPIKQEDLDPPLNVDPQCSAALVVNPDDSVASKVANQHEYPSSIRETNETENDSMLKAAPRNGSKSLKDNPCITPDLVNGGERQVDTQKNDGGVCQELQDNDVGNPPYAVPAIKQEDLDSEHNVDTQPPFEPDESVVRKLPNQHGCPVSMMESDEHENNSMVKATPRHEIMSRKDHPCSKPDLDRKTKPARRNRSQKGFPRPRGRAPKGMMWDRKIGSWVRKPPDNASKCDNVTENTNHQLGAVNASLDQNNSDPSQSMVGVSELNTQTLMAKPCKTTPTTTALRLKMKMSYKCGHCGVPKKGHLCPFRFGSWRQDVVLRTPTNTNRVVEQRNAITSETALTDADGAKTDAPTLTINPGQDVLKDTQTGADVAKPESPSLKQTPKANPDQVDATIRTLERKVEAAVNQNPSATSTPTTAKMPLTFPQEASWFHERWDEDVSKRTQTPPIIHDDITALTEQTNGNGNPAQDFPTNLSKNNSSKQLIASTVAFGYPRLEKTDVTDSDKKAKKISLDDDAGQPLLSFKSLPAGNNKAESPAAKQGTETNVSLHNKVVPYETEVPGITEPSGKPTVVSIFSGNSAFAAKAAPLSPVSRFHLSKGKVRNSDSGEWNLERIAHVAAYNAVNEQYRVPCGRHPIGKVWNSETGGWVPKPVDQGRETMGHRDIASPDNSHHSVSSRGRPRKPRVWNMETGGWFPTPIRPLSREWAVEDEDDDDDDDDGAAQEPPQERPRSGEEITPQLCIAVASPQNT